MSSRRIILLVGVLGTAFLGLDKVFPIVSSHGVGLEATTDGDPASLLLTTDEGDLSCLLRLRLSTACVDSDFVAALSNGSKLAVKRVEGDGSWIELSHGGGASPASEKFAWPSGVRLQISCPRVAVGGADLQDWYIYLADRPPDSKTRTGWRNIWFWVSLAFFFMSLLGIAYGALEQKPEKLTVVVIINAVVDSLEGRSKAETKKLRGALLKVKLEGASVRDALDAVGLGEYRQRGLWFNFHAQFLRRLRHLIGELGRYDSMAPHG